MPTVASNRLRELKAETTSEEWSHIERLEGFESYMNRDEFLTKLTKVDGGTKPEDVLYLLGQLGVVEQGERRDGTKTVRIADLYAMAKDLKIKRLGRR